MGVLLSLVNPSPGLGAEVELPLPAGVEPLALTAANSSSKDLPWSFSQGIVRFSVEDLPAGEYLWKLELGGRAGGDYLWPSARLRSQRGELWALSGSSRMRIEL
ncbi:MAG: hypothetical protein WC314_27435 [Vulcanimicrobiota bacterium]